MATPILFKKERIKFSKFVDSSGDCHEWLGPFDKDGYGLFRLRMPDGKLEMRAARVAFIFKHGSIAKGTVICHARKCRLKERCVNIDHLYAGTNSTNMLDRAATGYAVRGEQNGASRLTDKIADEIRKLFWSGGWTQRALAAKFKISSATVSLIVLRKTWKHTSKPNQLLQD